MNFIDILILIPAAWFGFKGLKNGLVCELASLSALVLGVWATFKFSDLVASHLGDDKIFKVVAFILIFVTVLVGVHFAGKLVEKVIKLIVPGIVNHLFGLLFGIGKVVLIFSVLFFLINTVDNKQIILKKETKEKSFFYPYVEPAAPWIKGYYHDKTVM
ncbi:MAG: CvpA family protein [Bacteroidales bacterium]